MSLSLLESKALYNYENPKYNRKIALKEKVGSDKIFIKKDV